MNNKLYKIISIMIFICLSFVACDNETTNNNNLEVNVPGSTLVEKLDWINNNAKSNTTYLIMLENNESLNPYILYYNENTNVIIRINGNGKNITLLSYGSLFTIRNGVTLLLNGNLTLRGGTNNTAALVTINSGGALKIYDGIRIINNENSSPSEGGTDVAGGGVHVVGGTFTMEGGEISGNASCYGGGVTVRNNGVFIMKKGEVSRNSASYNGGGVDIIYNGAFTMEGGKISNNNAESGGGGVHVRSSGTFNMSGGEITNNTGKYGGGGVDVLGGDFIMNGGLISYNTATNFFGGGVDLYGTFTMNGGEISFNTSDRSGGGIYVSSGTFIMNNGEISDNSSSSGGGVYDYIGTVIIKGGEIIRNTASSYGGGIYIGGDAIFSKSGGGTIAGYANTMNGNVVKSYGSVQNNRGHAVYVNSTPAKRRENTAGPSMNLDSSQDGLVGGWEN